jgi:hypothetical protein
VPLSEDEERILQEIAQQFYADDPQLARAVGSTTLYTHSVRRLKWSTAGFVLGLVLLVVTLSTSFLLAFGGFLVMLGSALMFERNARKLGKVGLDQVTKSVRASSVRDFFGSTGQRMRDRFRRDAE